MTGHTWRRTGTDTSHTSLRSRLTRRRGRYIHTVLSTVLVTMTLVQCVFCLLYNTQYEFDQYQDEYDDTYDSHNVGAADNETAEDLFTVKR